MEGKKIKVGASSCLLGEAVRYDGSDKYQPLIMETLADRFEWVPICPEVAIGMTVPRPPIQRVMVDGDCRLLRVDDPTFDLTDRMRDFAGQCVEQLTDVRGFILKARSPSCGLTGVNLFNEAGVCTATGEGAFVEILCRRMPELPVAEECDLISLHQVEMFANRVIAYHCSVVARTTGMNGSG